MFIINGLYDARINFRTVFELSLFGDLKPSLYGPYCSAARGSKLSWDRILREFSMTIFSNHVAGPAEANTELSSFIIEALNGFVIALSAILALAAVVAFA